jgi:hypothetical protein
MRRGPLHDAALLESIDVPDDESLTGADKNPFDESFYYYRQGSGGLLEFKDDACSTMSGHTYQPGEEHQYIPEFLVSTRDVIWHDLWDSITCRFLRFRLFSIYNRLLLIAVATNLGAVAYVVSELQKVGFISTPSQNDEALGHTLLAVSLNVLIALLLRNEYVINILYETFVINSANFPFWLRRRLAKLYGLGGFHSGCALSAFLWYTLYSGLVIGALVNGHKDRTHSAFLAISILVWIAFVAIIGLALPGIRARLHDYFELAHRAGGWSILILFWIQLVVELLSQSQSSGSPPGILAIRAPAFWILIIISGLIIWPWLWVRRMPIYVKPLSSHVARAYLHFPRHADHGTLRLAGRFARVSHNPLLEWHAFATIPEADHTGSTSGGGGGGYYNYSMLISRAGDFTAQFIDAPPQRVWVRQLFPYGVARVAALFSPVVFVATGSGIGPVLGVLAGHRRLRCRILWSTSDPLNTYGAGVVDEVRRGDPRAVVLDTAVFGRQNLVELAHGLYEEAGAEAVVVISNKKSTEQIVYGLESRAVAAYGPIFDS